MSIVQLPAELIELLCPIPPVATFNAGEFAYTVLDNPSYLYDQDIGWTVITKAGVEAFIAFVEDDLTLSSTYDDIDTVRKNETSAPITALPDTVIFQNGDAHYDQVTAYLDGTITTPGTTTDTQAKSLQDAFTDWLAILATPTVPGPTSQTVTDPDDPRSWLTEPYIINHVWWHMLKQYCMLSGGASNPGSLSGQMYTDFWAKERATLRDIDPGAMPLVLTAEKKLYLACAFPLLAGRIVYVCELQMWERAADFTDSVAVAEVDMDQWFGGTLLAMDRSTDWLLRRAEIQMQVFPGIVWDQIDLTGYPDLPLDRSSHTITGLRGHNIGYFWYYNNDDSKLRRISCDTLAASPNGGTTSPVVTPTGSGLSTKYSWSPDLTDPAQWGDYVISTNVFNRTNPIDTTVDLGGVFTIDTFATLALPYSYRQEQDGVTGYSDPNFKYEMMLGYTGFEISGAVGGIEYPYSDYSEPNTPGFPFGPFPYWFRTNEPIFIAGTDLVDTAPEWVTRLNSAWGSWPLIHWARDINVLQDDAAGDTIQDWPMLIDIENSRSHDTSVTTAPYRTYGISLGSQFTTVYAGWTVETAPKNAVTGSGGAIFTPGVSESVGGSNFHSYYINSPSSTSSDSYTLLDFNIARFVSRTGTGTLLDPFVYVNTDSITESVRAMLVESTIRETTGGSGRIYGGVNGDTVFTVDNEDGIGNPLTPPTITRIDYRELRNSAIHFVAMQQAYDTSAGTITVVAGSFDINFDVEFLLKNYKTNDETVIRTVTGLTLTTDTAARNGYLGYVLGDTFTATLMESDSISGLPSDEFGVYLRLVNVTWDLTVPPTVSATIGNYTNGVGTTLTIKVTLINTAATFQWQETDVAHTTNTRITYMSYLGSMLRTWSAVDSWSASGGMTGVSCSSTTGVLSGTPTSTNAGAYHIAWAYTHPEGSSSPAGYHPVLVNDPNSFAVNTTIHGTPTVGREACFRIWPAQNTGFWSRHPDSVAVTNVPPGMVFDAYSGVGYGIPTKAGTYVVKWWAEWLPLEFGAQKWTTASAARTSGTLSVTVVENNLGTFTDQVIGTTSHKQVCYQGQPFELQVTAIGNPTGYSASSLPTGLSINATTGLITGTPAVASFTGPQAFFNSSVTVTRGLLTSTIAIRFRVFNVLTCPVKYTGGLGDVGYPVNWRMTTEPPVPGALQWSASGLPSGLSINADSGLITGTPSASGSVTATITVTGADATARSQDIDIYIHDAIDGFMVSSSGWRQMVLVGSTAVSATPPIRLPSPWMSGQLVVRPIKLEITGSTIAAGASGTGTVMCGDGAHTVDFWNMTGVSMVPASPPGTGWHILTLVEQTSQDILNLPGLADFQTKYYAVQGAQISQIADHPSYAITWWNTMDTTDYFTTIDDWVTAWPATDTLFATQLSTVDADCIKMIWFNDDPLWQQNPNQHLFTNYTADNGPQRYF